MIPDRQIDHTAALSIRYSIALGAIGLVMVGPRAAGAGVLLGTLLGIALAWRLERRRRNRPHR